MLQLLFQSFGTKELLVSVGCFASDQFKCLSLSASQLEVTPVACVGCLQFLSRFSEIVWLTVASHFPQASGLQAEAKLTQNLSDIANTSKDRLKEQPDLFTSGKN